MITGWDAQALELGFGFALALLLLSLAFSHSAMTLEAGPLMRRFICVTRAVAWRSIHNTLVNPAILVPVDRRSRCSS